MGRIGQSMAILGVKKTNCQRKPDINWMVLWHWLYHIIPIDGMFHEINSPASLGVTPMAMETSIWLYTYKYHYLLG